MIFKKPWYRNKNVLITKISEKKAMPINYQNLVLKKKGCQLIKKHLKKTGQENLIATLPNDICFWGWAGNSGLKNLRDGDLILFLDNDKAHVHASFFYSENYFWNKNLSQIFWSTEIYEHVVALPDPITLELDVSELRECLDWKSDKTVHRILNRKGQSRKQREAHSAFFSNLKYREIIAQLIVSKDETKSPLIDLSLIDFNQLSKPIRTTSYLYFIWPSEFKSKRPKVFKFGKTDQYDPNDRIKSYGEEAELFKLFKVPRDQLHQIEQAILDKLKEISPPYEGKKEYFQIEKDRMLYTILHYLEELDLLDYKS